MHHVKNGSDATLSFWHRQDDGLQGRVHLAPGEAGDFEVDPGAAEFAREGVTLTTPRAAPSARPARKAAARKAPAKKTAASTAKAPPAPPEPASPEA